MSNYLNKIIGLYNNPINIFEEQAFSTSGFAENLSCGDEVKLFLKVDNDGLITNAYHKSEGCAFCVASACAVTELAIGKRLADLGLISQKDVCGFLEIDVGSARENCIKLALVAASNLK